MASKAPYPGNLTLNIARELLGLSSPLSAPTNDELTPSDEPVTRANFAKEQRAIEKRIVGMINRGEWDLLQPNSGNAIDVGSHQLCVGFQEDEGSGYRAWYWHGHIVIYDEEGYLPEYINGHYFQPLLGEDAKSAHGVGLGELLRSFAATGIKRGT